MTDKALAFPNESFHLFSTEGDEEVLQFVSNNTELAEQALRSAYAEMRAEQAKERAKLEHARLEENMYEAIVNDAPRYLKQLRALQQLDSHNSLGSTELAPPTRRFNK